MRSNWAPRKAPGYPTARHYSRNKRKSSVTFFSTLSWRVVKALSQVLWDIVVFRYSRGQSADKELEAIVVPHNMLRPQVDATPDDETEVDKLSPFLVPLRSHVLQHCSRVPLLDAPEKRKNKASQKRGTMRANKCNVALATSQRKQWNPGLFIEIIIYFKLLPAHGID